MIDELKLLDTAIKALTALRDIEDNSDEDYREYLQEHIERLEQKQAEKILEYEAAKEQFVDASFVAPKNENGYDASDDGDYAIFDDE